MVTTLARWARASHDLSGEPQYFNLFEKFMTSTMHWFKCEADLCPLDIWSIKAYSKYPITNKEWNIWVIERGAATTVVHARWPRSPAATVDKKPRFHSSQPRVDQSTVRNASRSTHHHAGTSYLRHSCRIPVYRVPVKTFFMNYPRRTSSCIYITARVFLYI